MAIDRVKLKPIIDEMVRTGICPYAITLLVDHIAVAKASGTTRQEGDQAFFLWLSDGNKSIQGMCV